MSKARRKEAKRLSRRASSARRIARLFDQIPIDILERRLMLSADNWINPLGGSWEAGSNWSLQVAPGATDSAVIALPGDYSISVGSAHTISSITFGATSGTQTLNLGGNALTLGNGGTITSGANANISGGIIAGSAIVNQGTFTLLNDTINSPLDNQGVIQSRGGSNTVNGAITAEVGSQINVLEDGNSGTANLTFANGFTNFGTINFSQAPNGTSWSDVLNINSGNLVNAAGGLIEATQTIGNPVQVNGNIDNQGTLSVAYPMSLNGSGSTDSNEGTINLAGGNLTLGLKAFTNSGAINVVAGQSLVMNGGTFSEQGTGVLSGPGSMSFTNVTANLIGNLTNSSLGLSLTSSTVNGPATLINATGQTLALLNDTINSPLDNRGVIQSRGGSNTINGAITAETGSQIVLMEDGNSGTANLTFANGFTNFGTINFSQAPNGTSWSDVLNINAGTLVNVAGGLIEATQTIGNPVQVNGNIDNQGTLNVGYPMNLGGSGSSDSNEGTINLTGGNLTLGLKAFTNSGAINVGTGQSLVMNGGTFSEQGAGLVAGPGTMILTNATANLASNLINNNLALTLNGSTVNGPATLINPAGQTLTLLNDTINAPLDNQGIIQVHASNTINGVMTAEAGSQIVLMEDGNSGTANLTFANGFANLGTIDFSQAPNGTSWSDVLNINSGTLVNAAGGLIEATQTIGSPVQINGNLDNQGTLNVGYPMSLNGSGSSDSNEGTINLTSGNLTLGLKAFTNSGAINIGTGQLLAVNGGSFSESGSLSGPGSMSWSSVTANLASNLSNSNLGLTVTNSTVNGPATLINASGQTLVLVNDTVNAPLDNQGIIQVHASNTINGVMTAEAGSQIVLMEDGNSGNANLTFANGFANLGTIDFSQAPNGTSWSDVLNINAGTLVNAAGGLIEATQTIGSPVQINGNLDNQGTLNVGYPMNLGGSSSSDSSEGTINLVGGNLTLGLKAFSNTGTIQAGTGNTLVINGGSFTEQGTLSGSGAISVNNATWSDNDSSFVLSLSSSNSTLTWNATVANGAGQSLSFLASTINGPGMLTNGVGRTLVLQNDTVNAPLDNQGIIQVHASNTINGAMTAEAGSQIVLMEDGNSGNANLTFANGFANLGTIDFSQAPNGTSWSDVLNINAGTLVNAAGGLIEATQTIGSPVQINGNLDNQGTLNVGYPMNLGGSSSSDSSEGTINLVGGNLTLILKSFANSGAINIGTGQSLAVNGGSFSESGSLSGPGSMSWINLTANLASNLSNSGLGLTVTSSTVNGPATLINATGQTLALLNDTINSPLDNQGIILVHTSNTINGAMTAEAGSQIVLMEDGNSGTANLTFANGFANLGTINFSQAPNGTSWSDVLNINAGTLVNAAGGLIEATQTIGQNAPQLNGNLDNQGTIDANSPGISLQLNVGSSGVTTNEALLESTNDSGLILNGVFESNGSGVLASTPGASISVNGSLLGTTSNNTAFEPQGNLSFNGGNSSHPDLLEAMSQDDGPIASGFQNNFAFANLVLNGAYVRLVDQSTNSPGGANAVYAAILAVPSGSTLDLNGLHLYTLQSNIAGTVINGTITPISGSGLPDLTPQSAVATSSNGTVNVTWNDANVGGGPLTVSYSDQVQLIDVTNANAVLGSQTVAYNESANGPIAPGNGLVAQQVSFNLGQYLSLHPGDQLKATITDDSTNAILEALKTNNIASAVVTPLALPDLSVSGLSIAGTGTGKVTISWSDLNGGPGPVNLNYIDGIVVQDATTSITLYSSTVNVTASQSVIAPGGSVAQSVSFQLPAGFNVNDSIVATVMTDQGNAVAETNESNNVGTVTVPGPLANYPDLAVQSLSLSGDSTGAVNIGWNDVILGTGAVIGSFEDSVVLTDVTSGAVIFSTSVQGNLDGGSFANFQLPSGFTVNDSLRATITVDSQNQIFESDETNNTATITVPGPLANYADLNVQNLTLASGSSGNVNISWSDVNIGNGPVIGSFGDSVVLTDATTGTVLSSTSVSGNTDGGQSVNFQLPVGFTSTDSLKATVTVDSQNQIFESDESNNTATVTVAGVVNTAPSVTLTAPASIPFGQAITLTATVSAVSSNAPVPTGTIQFMQGTNLLGSATLQNGSCILKLPAGLLVPGTYTLVAVYSGDANTSAGSSPSQQLIVSPAASSATLSTSSASVVAGQNVTFTAFVTSVGTPTGTVAFFSNGAQLASVVLAANGQATYSTKNLVQGTDNITVSYSGDSNHAPTTSKPITEVVSANGTSATNPFSIGTDLNAGLQTLEGYLANWASRFNLSSAIPVVGSNLADLFGISNFLSSVSLPSFDVSPSDTAATLASDLQAAGITITGLTGLVPAPTTGDLLDATWSTTVQLGSVNAGLGTGTTGLLGGLGSSLGITGHISAEGSLKISLAFGVNTSGQFFVAGKNTAAELDFDATGSLTSGAAAPFSGTGSVSIGSPSQQFKLALDANPAARFASGSANYLSVANGALLNGTIVPTGTASETLSVQLASGAAAITGTFGQTFSGTVHNTSSSSLSGQLMVPGLQTPQNTPDTIALGGSVSGNNWNLKANIPAGDTLAGFTLGAVGGVAPNASVSLNTVTDALTGSLAGGITVPLEGHPVTIGVQAALTSTGFNVTGSTTLKNTDIGAGNLLWVQNGIFTATIAGTFGSGGNTVVSVAVSADVAVVLPQPVTGTGTPTGAAQVNGFTGSVDSSGKLTLNATSFTVTAIPSLSISGGPISLTIDPAVTAPNTVIATLNNVVVQPVNFNLPIDIDSLSVRRNGFDLVATVGPLSGGSIAASSAVGATLTNATINVNVHLTTGASPALTGTIGFKADSATLSIGSTSPLLSATNLTANIPLSGPITVTAGQFTAQADGILTLSASNVALTIGVTGTAPVLLVSNATATIAALPGLNVKITNFKLAASGAIPFGQITTSFTGSVLQQIGLGGILPFDINKITITATNNFNALSLTAVGKFDFTSLGSLPFTPTVTIGTAGPNTFSFSLDLAGLQSGIVRPINLVGPITVGFSNLQLSPLTVNGSITIGGYQNGVFVPTVGGSFGFKDGASASFTASIGGTLATTSSGTTLDATAQFQNISFQIGQAVTVKNANLAMELVIDDTGSKWTVNPTLQGANIGSLAISLGNLLTLTSTGVNLNFGPAAGQPLVTFATLGVAFNSGASLLNGFGGSAQNFGINSDGSIFAAANAGISLTLPANAASAFGLPSWIPFFVTSMGIKFENGFFASGSSGTIANPADIGLVLSGGIGSPNFPITASVQGLELSIPAIINGRFPFTAIAGGGFGVQPITVGPVTIGGSLNFGQTDAGKPDNIIYLDIQGIVTLPELGTVGGRLIVSQSGPVALAVSVPLGIPFGGPTGLLLSSVTGGVVFGQAPTTVNDAADLKLSDLPSLPPPITTPAQIAALVKNTQSKGWTADDSIALSATISDIYLPGIFTANLGLSINTSGELAGFGSINALGFPFADAAVLLNVSNPDDPQFLANITAPTAGSPLGFVLPANLNFGFTFDGQGLPQAIILGFRTFITQAASSTESIASGYIGNLLDAVVTDLNTNPNSPLGVAIFGQNYSTQITRATLINALLSLIPQNLAGVDLNIGKLTSVVQAFESELISVIGSVAYNPTPANLVTISGLLTTIGDAGQAGIQGLGTFVYDMQKAEQAAASSFITEFNPSIEITGNLQPVVLGIPFGAPTVQASLDISKQGVSVGVNISPTGIIADWLSVAFQVNPALITALQIAAPIPFGLVGADHLDATLELPFSGGFVNDLVGGTLATQVDPFSNNWLVSLGGNLSPYGIQLASITGAAFGPNDDAASRLLASPTNFTDPITNPNKIYVSSPTRLATVESLGGVILNSNLLLPTFLFEDPSQLLASLPPVPSSPLQFPTYFAALAKALKSEEIVGQVQAYMPSPANLFSFNFNNYTAGNRITPSSAFSALTGSEQQAVVQSLLSNAYVEGIVNAKLLGIPLANMTLEGSATQLTINGSIPWLANLNANFDLSFKPEPVSLADFVTIMGRLPTPPETNSNGTANISVPVVGASASITTATLDTALKQWGLGNIVGSLVGGGSATFSAYSPGFDVTSSDPLQRNGGFEMSANLSIPGILNNAAFSFILTAPAGTSNAPDFSGSASAAGFTPIPGMTLTGGTITVSNQNGAVSIGVNGDATLFGVAVHVQGQLNPNFTGSLTISAQPGKSFDVSGLSFSGNLTLKLTKLANGNLAGTIAVNARVALPTWLTTATGKTTATLSGTLSSTTDYSLSLGIASHFNVGNLGVAIVGATGTGNATFTLVHNFSSNGIGISGALLLLAGNGLGLLSVSGTLNTVSGAGSLTVGFGSTGSLNLGGFIVTGNATLAYTPTNFSISVNGTLSIPGMLSNAVVTGAITGNGIARLTVSSSTLRLDPITIDSATLALLRGNNTYILSAQATANLPNIISNATMSGQFASDGTGFLALDATSVNLFGFTLNGAFAIVRTSTQLEFSTRSAIGYLGQNVSVSGDVAFGAFAESGAFALNITNGAFVLAGWSISGAFTLDVTPTSAAFAVTNGLLAVPGLGSLGINGSLDSNGVGLLDVNIPSSSPLQIGGANFLSLSGDFNLTTTLGAVGLAASFAATNVSLAVAGIGNLNVPQFNINSDGTFNVAVDSATLQLGGSNGLIFNLGTLVFSAEPLPGNPSTMNYSLQSTGASVEIGAIGQTFNLPTFDLSSRFFTALNPGSLSTLSFGLVQFTGNLVFQDNNGVFEIIVEGPDRETPPELTLPGFDPIDLTQFTIASDGSFNVSAFDSFVGISSLGIANASFTASMNSGGLQTLDVNISGGQLDLPIGGPVQLPSLDISTSASFSDVFDVPGLQLGSQFSVSDSQFVLAYNNGNLDFSLAGSPSVSFLAGSAGMTLNSLDFNSDGTFSGSVTGQLSIFGYLMDSATFDLSLSNGVLEVTLPASRAANINLGFATLGFSGSADSNGNFSFTASWSVNVAGCSGTAAFTIDNSGFTGSFTGNIPGFNNITGSIDSSGTLTVDTLFGPVSISL